MSEESERKCRGRRFPVMSDQKKQRDCDEPHMEKQIMDEPQEEFVADQSVPSVSMTAERKGDSAARENDEAAHSSDPGGEE